MSSSLSLSGARSASIVGIAVTFITFGAFAGGAKAALVINITEVFDNFNASPEPEMNIVATFNGSVDLTGLTLELTYQSLGNLGAFPPSLNFSVTSFGTTADGLQTNIFRGAQFYTGMTVFPTIPLLSNFTPRKAEIGSGTPVIGIQSLNGPPVQIDEDPNQNLNVPDLRGRLVVPLGYQSGDPLNATDIYTNTSFADIGLQAGTFVWSWDTGSTTESVTVNITPIPEPSTWIIVVLGVGSLVFLRSR